ncbi:MAG: hypothetical protein ACHQWU_09860 [Gemmatimonadales bacterium]|jgi:hypothetical protein
MAGPKLDSAGTIKLKMLDDALLLLTRVHNIVEQYGLALKRNQPTSSYVMNLRRTLPSLAENLKLHFGMISEQVLAVNLASSRGASETMRLRTLREGVAQIKQALEIAITNTKAKHTAKDEPEPAE